MERIMQKIFDYQKFEGNSKLQKVIDSVHAKYALRELSESDLLFVNAAGMKTTDAELRMKPVRE